MDILQEYGGAGMGVELFKQTLGTDEESLFHHDCHVWYLESGGCLLPD